MRREETQHVGTISILAYSLDLRNGAGRCFAKVVRTLLFLRFLQAKWTSPILDFMVKNEHAK